MAGQQIPRHGNTRCSASLLDRQAYEAIGSRQWRQEDPNLWPRHVARKWIVMLFLGTCLLYCARMVTPICAVTMAAAFHWTKIDSGLVLGGFFWGYCFTQILGGHASDKLGGELVLVISAASWAAVTAGTPLLALEGHTVVLMTAARFLMGLLQGVFFPALVSLCSQRVEKGETGFLMSTLHSGTYMGTLLAGGLGSLILDQHGWESMFYGVGLLAGLWALVLWYFFLKGMALPKQLETRNNSAWSLSRAHWQSLLKKPPVCAMVFAHMCMSGTSNTMLSWLPTYFKESFPHASGWVYNMVPWLISIPSALVGGWLSDFLISRGYYVIHVRKIMQTIAIGGSSICMMLLSWSVSYTNAVVLISAYMSISTFICGGVSVNVQDLSPSCAGAIYGFMNMMGALMGLVMVYLSGYVIEVTLSWAMVFSVIILVNVTGLAVFLIFGDAKRLDLEDSRQIVTV